MSDSHQGNKEPALFSLGGMNAATLLQRVQELEAENWRLRMALALMKYKPLRKMGRPRSKLSDADLLRAVEMIMAKEGASNPAEALRRMHGRRPVSARLTTVRRDQQIKTIQNALARARQEK